MSELKFDDIKIGDKFYDPGEKEKGMVVSVTAPSGEVGSWITVRWDESGELEHGKYDEEIYDWVYEKLGETLAATDHNSVTAPSHYNLPNGLQVIDLTKNESFLRGNVLKYVFRAPHKENELEDLLKARQYLNWEIERVEKESKDLEKGAS